MTSVSLLAGRTVIGIKFGKQNSVQSSLLKLLCLTGAYNCVYIYAKTHVHATCCRKYKLFSYLIWFWELRVVVYNWVSRELILALSCEML